jgi:hypothetical protein
MNTYPLFIYGVGRVEYHLGERSRVEGMVLRFWDVYAWLHSNHRAVAFSINPATTAETG